MDQEESQDQALSGQEPKSHPTTNNYRVDRLCVAQKITPEKLHHHPAKTHCSPHKSYLFNLCDIDQLIKPPDKSRVLKSQNQLSLNFPGQK